MLNNKNNKVSCKILNKDNKKRLNLENKDAAVCRTQNKWKILKII